MAEAPVGSRSSEVDLEGYRRITKGTSIKLHPVFDDHHTTDGYRFSPIEYLRGVFSNWLAQGADAVQSFNWSGANHKPTLLMHHSGFVRQELRLNTV